MFVFFSFFSNCLFLSLVSTLTTPYRTSTSSLEQHTSAFGIDFPQNNTTTDSIAEEEEEEFQDSQPPPSHFNQDQTVSENSNSLTKSYLDPTTSVPFKSSFTSTSLSNPASANSTEPDIEIREFSSRNNAIFAESDDDTIEALNKNKPKRSNALGIHLDDSNTNTTANDTTKVDGNPSQDKSDSLDGFESSSPSSDIDARYDDYHDTYDDTVCMSALEMQQLAQRHYEDLARDSETQFDAPQVYPSYPQYGSYFTSRLEAIPESPALTSKMDSPVTDNEHSFTSNNGTAIQNPSRLSQNILTPTTTTENIVPNTPATSSSTNDTLATITPTTARNNTIETQTPISSSSIASRHKKSPSSLPSAQVTLNGQPETPRLNDSVEIPTDSNKSSVSPQNVENFANTTRSNPSTPATAARQSHQHTKSSSSIMSRLSFGLFSSKSSKSSPSSHLESPTPVTAEALAPPQHRKSFRNKTISGVGRRRKLTGSTKLGPIGYSYESYSDSNDNLNNIIVFNKPSAANGPPHKHNRSSLTMDDATVASVINFSTVPRPVSLIRDTENDLLQANEGKASEHTKGENTVQKDASHYTNTFADGTNLQTSESVTSDDLKQPSYPPPPPPSLQKQDTQLQRLQKQQQQLEIQQKVERERKMKEKSAAEEQKRKHIELKEAQKKLEEEQFRLQQEKEYSIQQQRQEQDQQTKSALPYPMAFFRPLEPVEEVPSDASVSPHVFALPTHNSSTSSSLHSPHKSPRIHRASPRLAKSPRLRHGQFSKSGENLLTRTNSIISVISSSSAVSGLSTVSGVSSNVSSATGRSKRVHRSGRSHKHGSYRRVVLQSPVPSSSPNSYEAAENLPSNPVNFNNQQALYNYGEGFYNRSARSLANGSNSSILRTATVRSSTIGALGDMPHPSNVLQNSQDPSRNGEQQQPGLYHQNQHQHVPVSASVSLPSLTSSVPTISHSYSFDAPNQQPLEEYRGFSIMHDRPQQYHPSNHSKKYNGVNTAVGPTLRNDGTNAMMQSNPSKSSAYALSSSTITRPENSRTESFTSSSTNGTIDDARNYSANTGEPLASSSSLSSQLYSQMRGQPNSVTGNGYQYNYQNGYQNGYQHAPMHPSNQNQEHIRRLPSIGSVMATNVQNYLVNDTKQYTRKCSYKPVPRPISLKSISDYGVDPVEKRPDEQFYIANPTSPNARGAYAPSDYDRSTATPMSVGTFGNGNYARLGSDRSDGGNRSNLSTPQRFIRNPSYNDDSGEWEDYTDDNSQSAYPFNVSYIDDMSLRYQKLNPEQQQTVLQAMSERDIHRLREMIAQEKSKTKKMKRKMEKKRKMEEDQRIRQELLMTSVAEASSKNIDYYNLYIANNKNNQPGNKDNKGKAVKADAEVSSTKDGTKKQNPESKEKPAVSSETQTVTGVGASKDNDFANDAKMKATGLESTLPPAKENDTTAPLKTAATNSSASMSNLLDETTLSNTRANIINTAVPPNKRFSNDYSLHPIVTEKIRKSNSEFPTDYDDTKANTTSSFNSKSSSSKKERRRSSGFLRPFLSAPAASPLITDSAEFEKLSRKEKKKQKKIAKEREAKEQSENFTKRWEERQAIFEAHQREKQQQKELEKAEKKKKKTEGRKRSKSFGFLLFGKHGNEESAQNRAELFEKEKENLRATKSANHGKIVDKDLEITNKNTSRDKKEPTQGEIVVLDAEQKDSRQKNDVSESLFVSKNAQNPATQYPAPPVQPLGQFDKFSHSQIIDEKEVGNQQEPGSIIKNDDGLVSARRRRQSREYPPPEMLPDEEGKNGTNFKIHTPPITSSSPLTKFSKSVDRNHHSSSNLAQSSVATDPNASVDTGFTSNIIPLSFSHLATTTSPENSTVPVDNGNIDKFAGSNSCKSSSLAPPQLPNHSSSSLTHSYSQPNSISLASPHQTEFSQPLLHSQSYSDLQYSTGHFSSSSVPPLFANDKSLSSMSLSQPSSHPNTSYSTSSIKHNKLHDRILTNEAVKANGNKTKKKSKSDTVRLYDQYFLDSEKHLISSEEDEQRKADAQHEGALSERNSGQNESQSMSFTGTPLSKKKQYNHRHNPSVEVDLVDHLYQKPKVPRVSSVSHPIDNIDNDTDERYNDIEEDEDNMLSMANQHNIKLQPATGTEETPRNSAYMDNEANDNGLSPEKPIEFSDEEDDRSKTPTRESIHKAEKQRHEKREFENDHKHAHHNDSDNESLVEVGFGAHNSPDTAKLEELLESKRSKRRSSRGTRLSGRYSGLESEGRSGQGNSDDEDNDSYKPVPIEALAPPSKSKRHSDKSKRSSLGEAKPGSKDKSQQPKRRTSSGRRVSSGSRKSSGGTTHSHRRARTASGAPYVEAAEYPQYEGDGMYPAGQYPYGEYVEPIMPYYTMSPGPMIYGYPPDPSVPYRVHSSGQAQHQDMLDNMTVWGQPAPLIYTMPPHLSVPSIHQRTVSSSTETTNAGANNTGQGSSSSTTITTPLEGSRRRKSGGSNKTNKSNGPVHNDVDYEPLQSYNPQYLPYGTSMLGPTGYPYMVAPGYGSLGSNQPVPVDYPNMMMPMGGYGYDEYDGAGYETMPGIYAPQPQPVLFNSDMDGANNRGISPQAPGTLSSLMTFLDEVGSGKGNKKDVSDGPITASDEEAAIEAGGEGFGVGYEGAHNDMFFIKLQKQVKAAQQKLLREKERQEMKRGDSDYQIYKQQPQSHHHHHHRERSREQQLLELAREEEKRLQRKEKKKRKQKEQRDLLVSGQEDNSYY